MTTLELFRAWRCRLRRTGEHLRAAGHELFARSAADLRTWMVARRIRMVLTAVVIAAVAAFFATTRVAVTRHWYGVFLLRDSSDRFELTDDLKLGQASRLIWGVTFPWIHDGAAAGALPRLELTWDEEQGSGSVASLLADGARIETYFSRYVDDDGKAPAGLFVGGATGSVAASDDQDESGMAVRNAGRWHHVWCNVNEILLVGAAQAVVYPSGWTFRGSRVLIGGDQRVVLESEHELVYPFARLRMERFAYFTAGRTFFRLGINLINVGDAPVHVSYGYGDEPWVGRFGSADGNVGWDEEGVVQVVGSIAPRVNRWAGILDTKTGLANFLSWEGSRPDLAYFGNRAGTPSPNELGTPLAGNEIAIGLEWRDRVLAPGETLPVRLSIGIAGRAPDGRPTAPPGAVDVP